MALDLRSELLAQGLESLVDRPGVEAEPADGVAPDPDPVARFETVLGAAGDGPEALVELLESALDDVGAVAGGGGGHVAILARWYSTERSVGMAERPIAIEEDRTAAIFRTAAEIFQRKGYHATAMGEIAGAVDLTKAGLYYYVKGKEDLLFLIMSFAMDRLEGWVEAARAHAGPEQRLRSIINSHALGITLDGNAITLLVDETEALAPEHREKIRRRQRAYYEFIRDSIAELGAAGRSGIDPKVGAFGILGLLMWLARWYRRDGELGGEEVARQITAMALEGILTKQGTGGEAARRGDIDEDVGVHEAGARPGRAGARLPDRRGEEGGQGRRRQPGHRHLQRERARDRAPAAPPSPVRSRRSATAARRARTCCARRWR